jgi:hypothetical protein
MSWQNMENINIKNVFFFFTKNEKEKEIKSRIKVLEQNLQKNKRLPHKKYKKKKKKIFFCTLLYTFF